MVNRDIYLDTGNASTADTTDFYLFLSGAEFQLSTQRLRLGS